MQLGLISAQAPCRTGCERCWSQEFQKIEDTLRNLIAGWWLDAESHRLSPRRGSDTIPLKRVVFLPQ